MAARSQGRNDDRVMDDAGVAVGSCGVAVRGGEGERVRMKRGDCPGVMKGSEGVGLWKGY